MSKTIRKWLEAAMAVKPIQPGDLGYMANALGECKNKVSQALALLDKPTPQEAGEFVKQVRAYLEGVTEGPWQYIICTDRHGIQSMQTMGSVFLFAHPKCYLKEKHKNERFIAQARTDLPKALDFIDRQAEQLAEKEKENTELKEKLAGRQNGTTDHS